MEKATVFMISVSPGIIPIYSFLTDGAEGFEVRSQIEDCLHSLKIASGRIYEHGSKFNLRVVVFNRTEKIIDFKHEIAIEELITNLQDCIECDGANLPYLLYAAATGIFPEKVKWQIYPSVEYFAECLIEEAVGFSDEITYLRENGLIVSPADYWEKVKSKYTTFNLDCGVLIIKDVKQ